MNFKQFVERVHVPKTLKELDINRLKKDNKLIELTGRAADIKLEDYGKFVVLPSSSWVAVDTKTKTIYSYSPVTDTYGKFVKRRSFLTCELNADTNTLAVISSRSLRDIKPNYSEPIETKNYVIEKEDMKMSSIENQLDSMLRDVTAPAGDVATKMDTFDAEKVKKELTPEQLERKKEIDEINAKYSAISNELSANVSQDALAKLEALGAFNREHGGLYGLIVNSEPVIKISKRGIPAKDGKNFIASAGAPQHVVDAAQRGENIPAEYKVKENILTIKQAGPSAVKAAVLGIPAGGLFSPQDVADDKYELDTTNTAIRKILVTKDEAITFGILLFAKKMYDRTVDGDALREIIVKSTYKKPSNDPAKANQPQKLVSTLKATADKSLFTETNFFPIKTFETLNVSEPLTAENAKKASVSAFYQLTQTNKRMPIAALSELDAKYAARITDKSENGVANIESDYFVAGKAANFFGDEPKHWLTKQPLNTIEIPVREEKVKEGKAPTYPYKVYSVTSSSAINGDSAYLAKTSLYLDRYAKIRSIIGEGILNPQQLKAVTTKSNTSGKGNGIGKVDLGVSLAASVGLLKMASNHTLDTKKYEGVDATSISSEALMSRMSEARARRS